MMYEMWLLDLSISGDTRFDVSWFPTKVASAKLWLRWNLMIGGE